MANIENIVSKRRKCFMWFPICFTTVAIVYSPVDGDYDLEIEKGLIRKEIKKINLYRITDVSFKRSFLDFLFLRGTLEIKSTDPKYKTLRITNIRMAREFGDRIETYTKQERDRVGVKYQEVNNILN